MKGKSRKVEIDKDTVIKTIIPKESKIVRIGGEIYNANRIEHYIWERYKGTAYEKYLCPVISISSDYSKLVMKRAKTFTMLEAANLFGEFNKIDSDELKNLIEKRYLDSFLRRNKIFGLLNNKLVILPGIFSRRMKYYRSHGVFDKIEKRYGDISTLHAIIESTFPETFIDCTFSNIGLLGDKIVLIDYGHTDMFRNIIKGDKDVRRDIIIK